MEIRPLPADEAAVRRYAEELWLPYHRELEATVERHALADDIDLVAAETEFRLDLLESATHRIWVAIDRDADPTGGGESGKRGDFADGELVGYVTTEVDESPAVFDRPDRLVIGDIYVRESHRGSGLARELVERAAMRARAADCPELRLDVDADNDRALAFYDKLGFETYRRQMATAVDDV